MKIGSIDIATGAALAPMAGISDVNMRILCHEQQSAYSISEMLSAKGYVYAPDRSIHKELLCQSPEEGVTGLQLFGSEVGMLTKAIEKLNATPFRFFDFNMGCPAHKIVSNGEGSALMREPVKAGHLISAMVKASVKPVTVKIRAGWDSEHINAVEIARIAEESGAAAVCVHPRTRDMFYSGRADWDIIAAVKKAVHIPVIGNGDIQSGADALKMQRETDCDSIMVARAARGNVWIFREIYCALHHLPYSPPSVLERIKMLLRHLDMQVAFLGESLGVMEMRKHIAWYLQGMPGSGKLRANVNQLCTCQQVKDAIYRYTDTLKGEIENGKV